MILRHCGIIACSLALAGGLVSCAEDPEPVADDHPGWISTVADGAIELNYQSSSPLTTTNAASAKGSATAAQQLSARLYPGVHVAGPNDSK